MARSRDALQEPVRRHELVRIASWIEAHGREHFEDVADAEPLYVLLELMVRAEHPWRDGAFSLADRDGPAADLAYDYARSTTKLRAARLSKHMLAFACHRLGHPADAALTWRAHERRWRLVWRPRPGAAPATAPRLKRFALLARPPRATVWYQHFLTGVALAAAARGLSWRRIAIDAGRDLRPALDALRAEDVDALAFSLPGRPDLGRLKRRVQSSALRRVVVTGASVRDDWAVEVRQDDAAIGEQLAAEAARHAGRKPVLVLRDRRAGASGPPEIRWQAFERAWDGVAVADADSVVATETTVERELARHRTLGAVVATTSDLGEAAVTAIRRSRHPRPAVLTADLSQRTLVRLREKPPILRAAAGVNPLLYGARVVAALAAPDAASPVTWLAPELVGSDAPETLHDLPQWRRRASDDSPAEA